MKYILPSPIGDPRLAGVRRDILVMYGDSSIHLSIVLERILSLSDEEWESFASLTAVALTKYLPKGTRPPIFRGTPEETFNYIVGVNKTYLLQARIIIYQDPRYAPLLDLFRKWSHTYSVHEVFDANGAETVIIEVN